MKVAGAYIVRNGAYALVASAELQESWGKWSINPVTEMRRTTWGRNDKTAAREKITKLAAWIGRKHGDIDGLAIATYGPMVSLTPGDEGYGVLNPKSAHEPVKGTNLYERFKAAFAFGANGRDVEPTILTDAQAGAIGEAHKRNTRENEILAYIICGGGIGLGVVAGRMPFASALHPEFGLMPIKTDPNDPLEGSAKRLQERSRINPQNPLRTKPGEDYGISLSQAADHDALVERLRLFRSDQRLNRTDLAKEMDTDFWRWRSDYLAQACLTCTSLLTPHKITIAAYIDPNEDIGPRTHETFEKLLEKRSKEKQPVFDYPALKNFGGPFICDAKHVSGINRAHIIAERGLVGACHYAASIGFQSRNKTQE